MVLIDATTKSIAMTRGDYAALVFCAYQDDGQSLYALSAGDKVRLEVGKKYGDPILVLEKEKVGGGVTSADDYTIEVEPEKTKDMKFGDYVYDVSIVFANGKVTTYIGDTGEIEPKFTILKEVGNNDA